MECAKGKKKKTKEKEAKSNNMGSRGTASRRLMKELTKWQNEGSKDVDGTVGIERLGPVNDDEILRWEAIINGRGIGSGYDGAFF